MSTPDSYQSCDNTTKLCIGRERDLGRLYESGYKNTEKEINGT